jgi:YidC/Oxa1 family membrane protein insertase
MIKGGTKMSTVLQPIITVLNMLLSTLQGFTHDWGIAVILLTLLIRASLFLLNLRTAKQQVRQAHIQPQLGELRKKYASDTAKLSEGMMKLYSQYGIKPLSTIAGSLIQAPIFLGLYQLFISHGSTMTSGIIPWVTSLGQLDPMHIVPIAGAVITFASMLIPLTSEMAVASSMLQRAGLPLIMVGIFASVMWWSPVAVCLYSATSSLFALMERGFYRTSFGKRLILEGMPEMAVHK